MALEKQSKAIGEFSYEVTQFGAKLGNRVLMKVLKSLAPVFAATAGATTLKALNSQAIAGALGGISEDEFDWIVDQFAGATTVQMGDRSPSLRSVLDLHFAGRYLEELEWLGFALEVNYGPFFRDMKRKAAERLAVDAASKGASSSSSPSTSTGPSNAS